MLELDDTRRFSYKKETIQTEKCGTKKREFFHTKINCCLINIEQKKHMVSIFLDFVGLKKYYTTHT